MKTEDRRAETNAGLRPGTETPADIYGLHGTPYHGLPQTLTNKNRSISLFFLIFAPNNYFFNLLL